MKACKDIEDVQSKGKLKILFIFLLNLDARLGQTIILSNLAILTHISDANQASLYLTSYAMKAVHLLQIFDFTHP